MFKNKKKKDEKGIENGYLALAQEILEIKGDQKRILDSQKINYYLLIALCQKLNLDYKQYIQLVKQKEKIE